MEQTTHTWNPNAKWINDGREKNSWKAPGRPAPFFRHSLTLKALPANATVYLSGLGWSEFYLNGQKVGNEVLNPAVSQYDRRARYVSYDVTSLLRKGENVFGVILGNGWYTPSTAEVWHFDKVSWMDYPKFLFDLVADNKSLLVSDTSWLCLPEKGPIVMNELRNGEFYDAREELPGWCEPGFDATAWKHTVIRPGPGGILTPQIQPACKVMATLPATCLRPFWNGKAVFDVGQNMAGWCRIRVRGDAGAVVTLRHSELLKHNQIDPSNINLFVLSGEFQTDKYTLKGGAEEIWEPRFTYHGFRYVEVTIEGNAELLSLEGRVVHTSFEKLTSFHSSDPVLDKLHQCTIWSYISNFVGIPTDCPHREKNGWTGDTSLAAETGLFHFNAATAYHDWLQSMGDVQRANGQLPGIVPTGGWGFNWGSGPGWDAAFILIPWYVYVYTGNASIFTENYPKMKLYMDFLFSMEQDGILNFGLGDWCHPDKKRIPDIRVTSTAYYFADAVVMEKIARVLGKQKDAKMFDALAKRIQSAFLRDFDNHDGTFAKGEMTSLACALYQGLVPDKDKPRVAAKLDELVRANRYRIDFGIFGHKYTLRALADNGYAETAYRLLMNPAFPGWVDWINHGATTLWENWNGIASQNHIMYGDIAAWMMQYLAGIVPDEAHPGFSQLTIRPMPPQELDSLDV
ncbi:MAG: family 78 glycoside hydrolase catalytic domain, partial [Victivallales bacterium]|nr:family 78 glycoside hydrolase catalytic domain [Victivallales bacterium]